MAFNPTMLVQIQGRVETDAYTCYHYSNWGTDDLTALGYIPSASAVYLQKYDLIYSIHPVNGHPVWYVVADVVSDVPTLQLVGPARDAALSSIQLLTNDVQQIMKWYCGAFALSGPSGAQGPKGDTGAAGPAGADGAPALAPTINTAVSRTLNSNFTPSTTRHTYVSYTVALQVTNPLLAGNSTAECHLEYSTNGGSSWVEVSNGLSTSSVALTVTVAITNRNEQVLCGFIPANALVRLRTATSGTGSVTYVRGQEVLV